jgi:hypothetical protein
MSAYTPRLRLLPRVSPSPQALADLARRLDWQFLEERTARFSQEIIWVLGDGASFVRWMTDGVIGMAYLQFEGPLAAAAAQDARAQIDVVTESDVLAGLAAATDDEARMRLLRAAGVVTSYEEFHPGVFAAFETLMRHSNPLVRRTAALAASYPGWREFEPHLERLSQDPDPGVQETATLALRALRSMRWGVT